MVLISDLVYFRSHQQFVLAEGPVNLWWFNLRCQMNQITTVGNWDGASTFRHWTTFLQLRYVSLALDETGAWHEVLIVWGFTQVALLVFFCQSELVVELDERVFALCANFSKQTLLSCHRQFADLTLRVLLLQQSAHLLSDERALVMVLTVDGWVVFAAIERPADRRLLLVECRQIRWYVSFFNTNWRLKPSIKSYFTTLHLNVNC